MNIIIFLRNSVTLLVITCFVNALIYSSAYATGATTLPYNGDLVLDEEYHDISFKVFEHRENSDPKPIDESPKYRSSALSLKKEMLGVLNELYADESNKLSNLEIGAIYFVYGYLQ